MPCFSNILFNIILPFVPMTRTWLLPSDVPDQNVYVKLKDRKRSLSRKKRPQRVVALEKQHNVKFRVVAVFKQPRRGDSK